MTGDEFEQIRMQNRMHLVVTLCILVLLCLGLFYGWRLNRVGIERLEHRIDLVAPR